ncbi:MAG: hypothetical protein D8M59_01440 [Planctomycetes bacterium]|nr:hypothetical protein [Planctomycetota bacterium]NOG54614.1 hypothetical protein [Planctomycetota bacterium]
MPTIPSEQELAADVVRWLTAQHWDVYHEVRIGFTGHIADIVAVRGPLLWIIECKRSLTLNVLAQADRWNVLKRSIAVPRPARIGTRKKPDDPRAFAYRVARRFKIGVLEVGTRDRKVYELVPAPIIRANRAASRRIRRTLHPGHKTHAPAGSAGGSRWTPYRQTLAEVRAIISAAPGCTLADIMQQLQNHHYPTDGSARSCISSALKQWEDWCFVDESAMPCRYYLAENIPPEVQQTAMLIDINSPDLTAEGQANTKKKINPPQ